MLLHFTTVYYVLLNVNWCFTTCYYFFTESLRKFEKLRECWRRLEKVGKISIRLEKVGENSRRLEKVEGRESSKKFEKVR